MYLGHTCVVTVGGWGDGAAATTLAGDGATTGAATGPGGMCPGIWPGAATLVETVATPGCCDNKCYAKHKPINLTFARGNKPTPSLHSQATGVSILANL